MSRLNLPLIAIMLREYGSERCADSGRSFTQAGIRAQAEACEAEAKAKAKAAWDRTAPAAAQVDEATAFEGWHGALIEAQEIFTSATDERIKSRASRLVTYLKAHHPPREVAADCACADCCLARAMLNDGLVANIDGLPPSPPKPPSCRVEYSSIFGRLMFDSAEEFERWLLLPWWRRLFQRKHA